MESALFLKNFWYFALHGSDLKRGGLTSRKILGENIVFGRDNTGGVFALRDNCPHRGVPLSEGTFDGERITCCYHGWQFDCSGVCQKIPALPEPLAQSNKIRAVQYRCEEVNGTIWVYIPESINQPVAAVPPPPDLMVSKEHRFSHVERSVLQVNIDHATIGLIDPAHVNFVHRSWFWKTQDSTRLKEKRFEPFGLGFRMTRHQPHSGSSGKGYRLFGGPVSTEITFQLPGHRLEHIQIGEKDFIASITLLTPVDETTTELNHIFFSTVGWIKYVWWPLLYLGRTFICQDAKVFRKLKHGLESDPKLLLVGDPDAQARWYYELKRQWSKSMETQIPFLNPLSPATLRWTT